MLSLGKSKLMVLETTYYSPENKNIISDYVGEPFSFFEALKRRGIGSKRMIIHSVSPNLMWVTNLISDVNYANIELRKKGIIIYINKGLRNFAWLIPYRQLVVYKTEVMSIHAQGKFIQFLNDHIFKQNKSFFSKLLNEKIEYDKEYSVPVY